MNVTPTLEGGLAIQPESETDWGVLMMISMDIGRPAHLAESLADLMDEQSDWEEFVVPDLAANFDSQCRFVTESLDEAREQGEKVIFVKPTDGEKWYGAVNQARMSLEARYGLNDYEEMDEAPAEVRSAHFRDRFYQMLLSMLLDYVLEV